MEVVIKVIKLIKEMICIPKQIGFEEILVNALFIKPHDLCSAFAYSCLICTYKLK